MKKQLLKFVNIEELSSTGIYNITFKGTNKIYIGSTIAGLKSNKISDKGFYCRWSKHLRLLKQNIHPNNYLQNAFNKYGNDNIEFNIIKICIDKNKIIELEQYYLDKLKPYNRKNGYNIQKKADRVELYNLNLNKKKIVQYDINGNFEKIHNSSLEASKELNVTSSSIYHCLQSDNRICKNKQFVYFTKNYPKKIKPYIKKVKTRKKVYQYTKDKKYITNYNSVKKAAESVNGSSGTLSYYIRKTGFFKGYYWSYERE